MIAILLFQSMEQKCDIAYQSFLLKYKKEYQDAAKINFCQNYNSYLRQSRRNTNIVITSIFDTNLTIPSQNKVIADPANCQIEICSIANTLGVIESGTLPPQIDLRTQGVLTLPLNQKSCKSSWAFATNALFGNIILRSQTTIAQSEFQLLATDLKLSVQWLISNTFGSSKYCESGDFAFALAYFVASPTIFPTIEVSKNYEFDAQNYQLFHEENRYLTPNLDPTNFLLPYNITSGAQTPVISLMNKTNMNISLAKSYLARGFAVISKIKYDSNESTQIAFAGYDGNTVLQNYGCEGTPNHQVIIVGYGKYKGIDVWVVQNSWGIEWGSEGSFYVEIGKNDFCLENYAYTVLPKDYVDAGVEIKSQLSPFSVISGKNGLDNSDGTFTPYIPPPPPVHWTYYIGPAFGAFGGLIIILVIIYIISKRLKEKRSLRQLV
ncbi:Cathepsin L [Spironucleus salmonicida]|uniref:Cathepsin L n=1 Tax=Spironucleus salmonicida TaxID=348837 RepID=V6LJX5_9EUKA|nr:Cathepsin L [Spironucleus salmonicida]|eukprot:EST44910.1 Cathepsin L [Spironucleus salmonicida]